MLVAVSGQAHLAHLAFAVSSEEGHVVDLIHHHKVLFLTLEILQSKMKRKLCWITKEKETRGGRRWEMWEETKTRQEMKSDEKRRHKKTYWRRQHERRLRVRFTWQICTEKGKVFLCVLEKFQVQTTTLSKRFAWIHKNDKKRSIMLPGQ